MGNKKSRHKAEQNVVIKQNPSTWTSLPYIPFEKFGKPILIDDNNFILVTTPSGYRTKTSKKHQPAGIYQYNLSKHKWSQLQKFPKTVSLFTYANDFFTSIINQNKSILYVIQNLNRYPNQTVLIKFCINNAKLTINTPETGKLIREHTGVMMNNEFHFFGVGHITWNPEINGWKTEYAFRSEWKGDWNFGFYNRTPLYIKSKEMIYIFGGNSKKLFGGQPAGCGYSTLNDVGTLDSIYTYSLGTIPPRTKKMIKLKVKLPEKLSDFGIVSCKNEKYILIFGGRVDDYFSEKSNRIYIFNVENNTIIESKLIMPFVGAVSAILISSNNISEELLTYGFIRTSYENIAVPQDIINIIHSMICEPECVHLIQSGLNGINADKQHVTINVDSILGNQ